MREFTDRERLYRLLETLGRAAPGPARLYLVGGATAVDHGWRPTTADVDMASFLATGLTSADAVWAAFEEMRPALVRFPAIDPPSFEARVRKVCGR